MTDGILFFEVTLKSQASEGIKQLITDLKQIEAEKKQERKDLAEQKAKQNQKTESQTIDDMIKQFGDEALEEAMGGIGEDPEDIDMKKKAKDLLTDIDNQGINNIRSLATNPQAMIGNQLLSMLGRAGPYGALAAAIIGIVISAPELYKAVIEALAVKGGSLNQDFRYSMEEQLSQGFDRALQFRRITGDSPIITVDTHGYIAGDPSFSGNSLVDSEITRTNRIGIREQSMHFWNGI